MKQPKLTLNFVKLQAQQFCNCKTISDLSYLFQVPKKNWTLLAFEPMYYHFSVPKPNGKMRAIEAPASELKQLQRQLNIYLQAIYYLYQTKAAYGFIPRVIGASTVKNIRTNAEQHIGCRYLLNVDFDDFFHQIKIDNVAKIFRTFPFRFDKYSAYTLAKICTYKERLPMGAPTSPVLSNFYTIALDNEISKWAYNNKLTYTRFVDDLSFSSKQKPITKDNYQQIKNISQSYNLYFGEDKTQFFEPNATKIVTGLEIGTDTVNIPKDYCIELQKDIDRLRAVIEVNHITQNQEKDLHLQKFKQEIMGKINFINQIKGNTNQQYLNYLNAFYDAQTPPEELSVRWTKFGNYL